MRYPVGVTLKILSIKLTKAPFNALGEIWKRIFPRREPSPQVEELRQLVHKSPLIIQIETTNICNAACAFCAYPQMKRPKGVMSMLLFKQIIEEYASLGGGPVSLTPVVGDVLLDPHFLERLELLSACTLVSQVSFTTNGIAFHRYSDDDILRVLELADYIQFSIGGLDAHTYQALYGVDRLDQVKNAMERILSLKPRAFNPANILFAFRTNDWKFEFRYRKLLNQYRCQGAYISHIWTYANYAGLLHSDNGQALQVSQASSQKYQSCIFAAVHMAIGWNGHITACGCTDFEVNELRIGKMGESHLSQVWAGEKRKRILTSFATGKPFRICRDCSAYKPDDAIFSSSMCRGIKLHGPLPAKYFEEFWGG